MAIRRNTVGTLFTLALLLSPVTPVHAESFQAWVTQTFGATSAAKTVYTTKPTSPPYAAPRGTEWILLSWQSPQLPAKTRWEWVLDTSGHYAQVNVTARDFPSWRKYHLRIIGNTLVQTVKPSSWAAWQHPSHGWTLVHKPAHKPRR